MRGVLHRLCLLILPVGCLIGWGCGSWTLWPERWRSGQSPHESALPVWAQAPPSFETSDGSDPASAVRVVDLSFDVIRAELPIADRRDSLKIWNHVDELCIEAGTASRLVRNGLRVGTALSGSWPAMLTVLEAAGARFSRKELFPQRGLPLVIGLEVIAVPEPIFTYSPLGRLMGKTFPSGEKVVNLDYAFHPRLGGVTETQISFEIRRDRGTMTWQRQGGVLRQVPDHDRHVFDGLTAVVTLNPGQFMVIGPHPKAKNAYLVGNRFLTGQRDGQRYETILFITPHAFQTRRAKRGAS